MNDLFEYIVWMKCCFFMACMALQGDQAGGANLWLPGPAMSTILTGQMLYYGQKMSQKRPPKIIFIVKSSADCFFQLISSSFAPKAQDDKIRCLILSDNT